MRNFIFFLSIVMMHSSCSRKDKMPTYRLWYDKPAHYFEESLPLGNGRIGACVFGGPTQEKIYLNDATLWAGEPVDPYMNPEAYKHLPAIREALASEDYKLADELNKNIQGSYSQSFAPLGTLLMDFSKQDSTENYYRELDIGTAIAKTTYDAGTTSFNREYFISHPDRVMVIRLTSDGKNPLSFSLGFESLLKYNTRTENNTLFIDGYAPYHAEPNYRGNIPDAVHFDRERGTRFSTYISTENTGETTLTDSSLVVNGADEVVIYIAIASSFNGYDKDPAKQGKDNTGIALELLNNAMEKGYEQIRSDHIADHRSLFSGMDISLGECNAPDLPTNDRLKRYAAGVEDKYLEQLYFQYGRYLLISSSRTEDVPANLQGIWNPYLRPPWSSNYTMNINVQENYWLAESANLSELHWPLLRFIENLSKTGEVTAKTFYGVDQGWASCHNSDIWAMSNPVGDFGRGHPVWACWNMSGPWLATHLWEHYLFTCDQDYLEDHAYPLMKGAAEFCLHWMVEDKDGYLITSPTTSPENIYLTPEGYKGATLYGATADLALIWECFLQTVAASEELRIDESFRDSLADALDRLHPYQVGHKGNLQEWYYDWEDAHPQHRHQSHLFGLHPGHHITPGHTPELAKACQTTLEIKGDESTGWSKGWRINLWARLHDGNHAYKMYRELLSYVDPDGMENTEYSRGGGTYPNLFDAHPPFQIDGNFGGAAGVIEMLVQSHNDVIHILPALPDAWPDGEIRGVCARGGFELSFSWNDGWLEHVEILSKSGNPCTLLYQDKRMVFETKEGETYFFDHDLGSKSM
jgi:alpha-L-fucosidase 2